jgi:hypothetical protein
MGCCISQLGLLLGLYWSALILSVIAGCFFSADGSSLSPAAFFIKRHQVLEKYVFFRETSYYRCQSFEFMLIMWPSSYLRHDQLFPHSAALGKGRLRMFGSWLLISRCFCRWFFTLAALFFNFSVNITRYGFVRRRIACHWSESCVSKEVRSSQRLWVRTMRCCIRLTLKYVFKRLKNVFRDKAWRFVGFIVENVVGKATLIKMMLAFFIHLRWDYFYCIVHTIAQEENAWISA